MKNHDIHSRFQEIEKRLDALDAGEPVEAEACEHIVSEVFSYKYTMMACRSECGWFTPDKGDRWFYLRKALTEEATGSQSE